MVIRKIKKKFWLKLHQIPDLSEEKWENTHGLWFFNFSLKIMNLSLI